MKFKTFFLIPFVLLAACGNSQLEEPKTVSPEEELSGENEVRAGENSADDSQFVLCKGADVSWLTEMEDQGIKFYPKGGGPAEDCLVILKDLGVNAVRLRAWVQPENKYNTMEDVLVKCQRAAELGMDIMIDFHYSDNWADPSKQTTPKIWADLNIEELVEALRDYTRESLLFLKNAGIDVKWVQVGNETGNGMLWPLGQADKYPKNYALLTTAGYEAVKEVYPEAKVIVHLQNGQEIGTAKWLFNILNTYKAKYDVAGFSLYPGKETYEAYVKSAKETMEYIVERYGKDVMLCEVGMKWDYISQCYNFLKMVFELGYEIPGDHYLGALYWEPECFPAWNGYDLGAFNNSHRPTSALDAFSINYSGVPKIFDN